MALKSSQDIMSYFKFTTCKRFYNKYQETHLQLVVERKNNNNKKGKSAKELTCMKRMIDKSRCRTYIVAQDYKTITSKMGTNQILQKTISAG